MDRRSLLAAGLAAGALGFSAARAQDDEEFETEQLPPAEPFDPNEPQEPPPRAARRARAPEPEPEPDDDSLPEAPDRPSHTATPNYPARRQAETYSRGEMVNGVSDFLGVSAESAAAAIERVFKDNGRPTAYIAGEEGSAAFVGGVRYGKGLLYMKRRKPLTVYWRGPSIGFDVGGNASRAFTLCYNLQVPEMIFRRFPGVDGSAYFIGGLGVNYQRAEGVTLAPIRVGVGLRLGASVGYLAYSKRRNVFPF